MVSSLLVLPIVYARPWLMEIEEKPVPTEARQRTFGPSAGHAALTFSDEMPSRFSPRHWGQSAAVEAAATSRAPAAITLSFMSHFYHERPRLHGILECAGRAQRRRRFPSWERDQRQSQ